MEKLILWLVLVLAGGWLLWLLASALLLPVQELRSTIARIAAGDFRPVIHSGIPRIFRSAASDLRVIAETLARQKSLLAEGGFSLSTILESMTEGVVITGPDLRIRQWNKAAASIFNLSRSAVGQLLPEVFISHEFQTLARHALQSGDVRHGELKLSVPGRSEVLHLDVTATALKSSENNLPDGILLVLHDVTRLRELEAIRREFVANVSHEFRTPLSVISGYLETLGEGDMEPAMARKAIRAMQRHAGRLNRLIEDLLTISRMEEKGVRLEKSLQSLEPILRGVVEESEREASGKGMIVALEIAPGLPDVAVDAHRIEQAFGNLLTNALRHGVPTTPKPGPGVDVLISAFTEGQEVGVRFRDHGPGIPLADQEHLFERFYRVGGDRARQTGGTGLGLSIVKNVVKAHGGRITLESTPGSGSAFTVYLPQTA